jgi:hypothetical protein
MTQPTTETTSLETVDVEEEKELTLDELIESSAAILKQFPQVGHEETLIKLYSLIDQHNTSMNVLAFGIGHCLDVIDENNLYRYVGDGSAYPDFESFLKTSEIARHGYQQLLSWRRFYKMVRKVENLGLDIVPILEYSTPLGALKTKHVERFIRSMEKSWIEIGRRNISEEEKRQELDVVRQEINKEIRGVLEKSEESLFAEAITRLKNVNELEPHPLFFRGVRHEGHEFVFEVRIPDDRLVWSANISSNKVRYVFEIPGDNQHRLLSGKEAVQVMEDELDIWPTIVEGTVEEDVS